MSWIEQTLADLARRRRMEAAPPGENAPQPTGMAGDFGFHPGPRGMVQRSQAMGLGYEPRANALVQAYQAYLKRSGRKQEPLLDSRVGIGGDGPRGLIAGGGARVLRTDSGATFRTNQTQNERAGLTFQQLQLPGGQRVNVYYGANGQRTVVPLPKRRK